MTKTIYTAGLWLLLQGLAGAQVSILTQESYGGTQYDAFYKAVSVPDGSTLWFGTSQSPVSGTKTAPQYGMSDGWLLKTDLNGVQQWQKSFGGTHPEDGRAMLLLGNTCYLGLSSSSGATGNKTLPRYGAAGTEWGDFWLLKTDLDANILWQKVYGTEKTDNLADIAVLPGNTIVLAGMSNSDISIDKTENSRGTFDYWLIAIDSSGNKLWDKTLGGDQHESLDGIKVTTDGLLLYGTTMSGVSGDKQTAAFGNGDIWLVKTDFSGNLQWEKTIGGDAGDYVNNLYVINDHIFICGETESVGGNMNIPNQGDDDGFIMELDADGNIIRSKGLGGSGLDGVCELYSFTGGGYMVLLSSASDVSGDRTLSSLGLADLWIVFLDENWNITDQFVLGGSAVDFLTETVRNADGSFSLMVNSSSAAGTGNKTVPDYGTSDSWFLRIKLTNGLSLNAKPDAFLKLYPNPAENSCQIVLPEGAGFEKLRVVNASGQTVHETNLNIAEGNIYTLNTASWAPGAYFIDLQNKQGVSLRSTLLKK